MGSRQTTKPIEYQFETNTRLGCAHQTPFGCSAWSKLSPILIRCLDYNTKTPGVHEKSLPWIIIFLYSWAIIAVEAIGHIKKHILHYKAIGYAIYA